MEEKELDEIRKSEQEILKEEKELIKLVHSEVIENKHIYKKLLEIEQMISGKEHTKFMSVEHWKEYIWESCKFRKLDETDDSISYVCEKLNGPCHFTDCPVNKA